jgi:rRNA maturation RNase YbeY
LNKNLGEIFITPTLAKKEAKLFGKTKDKFITLLFIHGLLHLKGMEHGSRMSRLEIKLHKQFGI